MATRHYQNGGNVLWVMIPISLPFDRHFSSHKNSHGEKGPWTQYQTLTYEPWMWRYLFALSPWDTLTVWCPVVLPLPLPIQFLALMRKMTAFNTIVHTTNNNCSSSFKPICDSFRQWKISIVGTYQIHPSCGISSLKLWRITRIAF